MKVPVLLKVCVLFATLAAVLGTTHALQDKLIFQDELRIYKSIKQGVVFQLYTRKNRSNPERLNIFNLTGSVASKYFDRTKPTKIYVHGWQTNGEKMTVVHKAFLYNEDCNNILMNWKVVDNIFYPVVRKRVAALGKWLSHFLDTLVDSYGLDLRDIHLVGHSLGAHISGVAGRAQGGQVGRITALDPAGPLFKDSPDRLTHESAQFVDVIHTCGNIFGYWKPIGHVDFYPNGGVCTQPGCHFDPRPSCSHNRAMDFLAESVSSKLGFKSWPFLGGPTGDFETNAEWALMGYPVNKTTRGVYFVKTSTRSPYAILPPATISKSYFGRMEHDEGENLLSMDTAINFSGDKTN